MSGAHVFTFCYLLLKSSLLCCHSKAIVWSIGCLNYGTPVTEVNMSPTSFAYYASGANDEHTVRGNISGFSSFWLVPRVMRDVSTVLTATNILGHPVSMPLFISGAAKAGLAHPTGEVGLARGAAAGGIPQMCPRLGTKTLEQMAEARIELMQGAFPEFTQFLQVYVDKDRSACENFVRSAEQMGFKAVFITVDSATVGKRERDLRLTPGGSAPRGGKGAGRWDTKLSWSDAGWLRSLTTLPLILKGIQSGADAVMAYQAGVFDGILVSNHGGRNLDFSRPSIHVLAECTKMLRLEGWRPPKEGSLQFNQEGALYSGHRQPFSVMLDGGVRRGHDIFKAVALGACAVGVGRPALYALAGYGPDGVERMIELLREELIVTMRNTGCSCVEDITLSMVERMDPRL